MYQWVRLAAAKVKHYLKTEGARAAASTLTPVFFINFFLQQEEPPFWQVLGRILSASGTIFSNWPMGTPVNGLSILLVALDEANIVDVGDRYETLITGVVQPPPILGTIIENLYIVFLIPLGVIYFWNFQKYWGHYRRISKERGGQDKIWADRAEILNPFSWAILRALLLPGIIILAPVIIDRVILRLGWRGIEWVSQTFYAGYGITMGGAFVELVSRIAEGMRGTLGTFAFIVLMSFLFAAALWFMMHYIIRFAKFLFALFTTAPIAMQGVEGLRDQTFEEPVREYLAITAELGATMLIVLLFPLLAIAIPALTGLWLAGWVVALAWVGVKVPPRIMGRGEKYYRRVGSWLSGDLFEDPEPAPPPQPNTPGVGERAGRLAKRLAESDPNYANAAAAAAGIQAIREARNRGFKNVAMDQMERKVESRVNQARSGSSIGGPAGSYNPREDTVKRMPEKLYEKRRSLDNDPEVNNAIFAFLADTYSRKKPMRPLSDLISEARKEVKALKRNNPDSFSALANRGSKLVTAAEIDKGDYTP